MIIQLKPTRSPTVPSRRMNVSQITCIFIPKVFFVDFSLCPSLYLIGETER